LGKSRRCLKRRKKKSDEGYEAQNIKGTEKGK
jgi:hypothetical protein